MQGAHLPHSRTITGSSLTITPPPPLPIPLQGVSLSTPLQNASLPSTIRGCLFLQTITGSPPSTLLHDSSFPTHSILHYRVLPPPLPPPLQNDPHQPTSSPPATHLAVVLLWQLLGRRWFHHIGCSEPRGHHHPAPTYTVPPARHKTLISIYFVS